MLPHEGGEFLGVGGGGAEALGELALFVFEALFLQFEVFLVGGQ